MYKNITQCRLCGNKILDPVLHLGNLSLTGVFPKTRNVFVPSGPLSVVKCREGNEDGCGLVQLLQTYDLGQIFNEGYGYFSSLNKPMGYHLSEKVYDIKGRMRFSAGDIVVDIGSNDGTLLKAYQRKDLKLVGIDPVESFEEHYSDDICFLPDYFSKDLYKQNFGHQKAKVITSFAMLYDLDDPLDFTRQVFDILDDEGLWIFEQSYLPSMLLHTAYDTICHEHLEYYRLKQVQWMLDQAGFKIIDVEINNVNGGSFCVTAAKKQSKYISSMHQISKILKQEKDQLLDTLRPYDDFSNRVFKNRRQVREIIEKIKSEHDVVVGYGASTKGNTLLQFWQVTQKDINGIVDINQQKIGSYTPGSQIPIISEEEAKRINPDCYLILPWALKDYFLEKEQDFLNKGGRFLIPLPDAAVYSAECAKI